MFQNWHKTRFLARILYQFVLKSFDVASFISLYILSNGRNKTCWPTLRLWRVASIRGPLRPNCREICTLDPLENGVFVTFLTLDRVSVARWFRIYWLLKNDRWGETLLLRWPRFRVHSVKTKWSLMYNWISLIYCILRRLTITDPIRTCHGIAKLLGGWIG